MSVPLILQDGFYYVFSMVHKHSKVSTNWKCLTRVFGFSILFSFFPKIDGHAEKLERSTCVMFGTDFVTREEC